MMNQQQLAGTFDLTDWHFTQTSSVSLQESLQRGMQHNAHELRIKHHTIATTPTFFRGRFPVLLEQAAHREPLPSLSLLFAMMMVCCCCG